MIRASAVFPAAGGKCIAGPPLLRVAAISVNLGHGSSLRSAPLSASASASPLAVTTARGAGAWRSGGGRCGGSRLGDGRRGALARAGGRSSGTRSARGSSSSGSIGAAADWFRAAESRRRDGGGFSGSFSSCRDKLQFSGTGGAGGYYPVTVTCSAGGLPSVTSPPATSDPPSQISVLFAAGGTGGHVYPAIAIADAVRSRDPTAEINFIGTSERMEWTAVPRAGYQIHPIPAVSIRRPLLTSLPNLLLPFRFFHALIRCITLIFRLKPDVVIGTGGYVSAPTCLAAAICRVPLVIQEQNAHAGIANRLLGCFAAVIFVAFAAARKSFPIRRCHVAGNPTREVFRAVREEREEKRSEAMRFFFDNSKKESAAAAAGTSVTATPAPAAATEAAAEGRAQVLLVLGGSLGAEPINRAVAGALEWLLDPCSGVELKGSMHKEEGSKQREVYVIWQTGARHADEMKALPLAAHPRVSLLPFIDRMDLAYAAADVVVARAGAVTCSELLATATPAILVPSPHVAEDHQTVNACAMVDAGASLMLPQSQLSPATLLSAVTSLLADEGRRETMRERAAAAATTDAADKMAQEVVRLARQHRLKR